MKICFFLAIKSRPELEEAEVEPPFLEGEDEVQKEQNENDKTSLSNKKTDETVGL